MEELNYTSREVTTTVKDFVGTEEELREAIALQVPINKFKGGFLVDESYREALVPTEFLDSMKINYITEIRNVERTVWSENLEEEPTIESTPMEFQVPELDEQGEVVMVQKTWKEYVMIFDSVEEGKICISAQPPISPRGNWYGRIVSEELYKWIELFGSENIHTKSNFESAKEVYPMEIDL